ncbi:MAG TPA: alpha/beta hydrolase [Solirubrobacteraceae bacterium]|nr:alpha/beta hydrolase [Solirubrobacteraceae bacterium]
MPAVTLSAGTIHYEESGPTGGRPIVFIHGYTMASSLWRPLIDRLAGWDSRCIAPTWPLGAHSEPMIDGADMTMEGVAALVAEFLEALDLDDVVLVGNDTGGAIAQIVATTTPERLGALVLTSCDAFEHFPPGGSFKTLIAAARFAPTFRAVTAPLRTRTVRDRGYGQLAHTDIDDLVREWVEPVLTNSRVREDLRRFTASLHTQTVLDAGARLPQFTKPALIAWSADDTFFAVDDGRRLADALPDSRFELIEGARTFSMIDQPDVLAELIAEFAHATEKRARDPRPDAFLRETAA